MKMKSFAMLAASGLLAASFAYVAPVMADDMNNSGQSMQAPSDNSNMQNPNGSMNNTDSPPTDNTGSNNSSTGSTDEGSPDTATGDDDY